jgi:hypothetical protein
VAKVAGLMCFDGRETLAFLFSDFRGQVQAKDYGEYNNYHSHADQNAAQLWVHE